MSQTWNDSVEKNCSPFMDSLQVDTVDLPLMEEMVEPRKENQMSSCEESVNNIAEVKSELELGTKTDEGIGETDSYCGKEIVNMQETIAKDDFVNKVDTQDKSSDLNPLNVSSNLHDIAVESGFLGNYPIENNQVTMALEDELVFNNSDLMNVTVVENSSFKVNEPVNSKTVMGDGSDSGVELNSCCCSGHGSSALQRAFSSNSGGYASSCGGLEDSITSNTTPAVSCDSSLISCYSTYEDTEDLATSTTMLLLQGGDGTSEGGSESSSVTGKDSSRQSRNGNTKRTVSNGNTKKRVETTKTSPDSNRVKTAPGLATASTLKSSMTHQQAPTTHRANMAVAGRLTTPSSKREKGSVVTTPTTGVRVNATKQPQNGSSGKATPRLAVGSSPGIRSRTKAAVDSSIHASKRDACTSVTKARMNGRVVSSPRNKTASSVNDGRWPSSSSRSQTTASRSRGGSLADAQSKKPVLSSSSSIGTNGTIMESKASALEKYATLPRRRRCKSPDGQVVETHHRSHSVSRDPSLNRAASLRKQHLRDGSNSGKSLPPYPRRKLQSRTRIYHEICVQTALTGDDVANALAGIGTKEYVPVGSVETYEQEVQVDERHEEVERLEAQLKLLTTNHTQLQADCDRQKQALGSVEKQLSNAEAEKLMLKEELDNTNRRVLAMLENVKGDAVTEDGTDSLQELETQLQSSGHVVIKQQNRITDLQSLCQTLQRDLEKSLAAQKTLLQQQQEIQAESLELQEFLQAEKLTLAEALRDAEVEISGQKQQLLQRELELQRQQEECKHLVRISEQRRQENLALQARLGGLEKRSKELLLQQGAAVSGAAVALSGLSSRLDGLVEQLVTSYDISEKDLEDVIFHNEAYSKSNSSVEASPEKTSANRVPDQSTQSSQHTPSSPKKGASFVTAVISAICNAAAQSPFASSTAKQLEATALATSPQATSQASSSGTTELLDSEKEPSVIMENDDDTFNVDPKSSNPIIPRLANSESLQNLSQAILVRQQSEMAQGEGNKPDDEVTTTDYDGTEEVTHLGDYCSAATLVDQIIDVDNLVTRLLKVLRILQLENETNIEELQDERVQLAEQVRREQENRKEMEDALWNWECLGARLRSEVEESRLQLQLKVKELEETKSDLQRYREQVEHLSKDVCNLSSMCQQAELQLQSKEQETENALQQWQQTGHLPSADTLARIITAHKEIPLLKERLAEKEKQLAELGQKSSVNKQMLTDNWHQAIREVRRQYDAIDHALEILQSVQGIVTHCPPLAKLQQELEETNFHCISSLPVVGADLNANAALVTGNGTHNGGSNGLNSVNPINGTV